MSEEKKCCGCCNKNKELNNEQLEKVTGGGGSWQNGKYICDNPYQNDNLCWHVKKVDGIANVCCCVDKTNGKCCHEFKDKCNCSWYDRNRHQCIGD